ncbi:hypothetical protein TWF694_006454 [Orbilia ellipsospora]|uniref:LysM domain-containing protein n=1 Tax=Orbilia ellipsospora TaxID=2528407 RepID=A0AAV9XLN7_9PEZI
MWLKAASIRIIYALFFTVISIISFTNAQNGTPTTSTAAATSPIVTPSPIQSGQPDNCIGWRYVFPTDTCDNLVTRFAQYGLTPETLIEWNPAIGPNCTGLIPKYFICVRLTDSDVAVSAPATTPSVAPTSTTPTSTITTPSPIQSGQPSNCVGWAFVRPTDDCDSLIKRYYSATYITRELLLEWNPAIAPNCTLTRGTFVCVQIPGSAPKLPTPTPTAGGLSSSTSGTQPSGTSSSSSPLSTDAPAPSNSRTGIIVGSVIGGVAVVALGSLFALWLVIRERRKRDLRPPSPPPKPHDRFVWETHEHAGFNQEGQFVKETRNVFVELPVHETARRGELPGGYEAPRPELSANVHLLSG